MKKIFRLYVADLRHFTMNTVAAIIALGLVVIPGLFAWFNIAASWNPFGNMKNLQFAIANEDEGYKSDLLPLKISIGDEVVDELRANSDLDWSFVTQEEAIQGTKSGEYYAAVVIPKDFSKNMMTFLSSDVDHTTLDYYDNEKLNAVAPKLTGQGADEISASINQMFAKTLLEASLNTAQSLVNELDDPNSQDYLAKFSASVSSFAATLTQGATTMQAYAGVVDGAQTLLNSSTKLVKNADSSAQSAVSQVDAAKSSVTDVSSAMTTSVNAVSSALSTASSSFDSLDSDLNSLLSDASTQATDSASALRSSADDLRSQASALKTLRGDLANLESSLPSNVQPRVEALLTNMDATVTTLNNLASSMDTAAQDIDNRVQTSKDDSAQVKDLASQAKSQLSSISSNYDDEVKPELDSLKSSYANIASLVSSGASDLKDSLGDVSSTASSADVQLTKVRDMMDSSSADLTNAANKLNDFTKKLSDALNSGDMDQVRQVLGNNPETLAATLASPVRLDTHVLFPIDSFGVGLTPYYTFLPLWVGSLLMIIVIKTSVSRKMRAELDDPKPWQLFFGRYGVFATVALLQATFSLGGTLLFLHVPVVHPWLFMLTGWVSAIVYSFFMYTMIASLGNAGKAISVLVLVAQMTGSDGTYPLQMLPSIINKISPFLPVTYSVKMLRSAIAGIYDNDYWIAMGKLLLFLVPLLFFGLVLRKLMANFNRKLIAQVEGTKLML